MLVFPRMMSRPAEGKKRESYPETAASIFDPFIRRRVAAQAAITCQVLAAAMRARENAPKRVTGHETD